MIYFVYRKYLITYSNTANTLMQWILKHHSVDRFKKHRLIRSLTNVEEALKKHCVLSNLKLVFGLIYEVH